MGCDTYSYELVACNCGPVTHMYERNHDYGCTPPCINRCTAGRHEGGPHNHEPATRTYKRDAPL